MLEVYTDGASAGNPGPSGIGVYITGEGHQIRLKKSIGESTNHQAEFDALLFGLQEAQKLHSDIVSARTDSKIVVQAIEKRYAKDPIFAVKLEEILALVDSFPLFFIKWIPEKENKTADLLAKSAIMR
ncbi:ribonuclease HI family protein [Paenisporosarcina cavernae]|uniref:Reverse transcriptase-like protein n=1 Tax=Paenisporosarcina cavernae TaxID=2320858 RepID=A0A385YSE6_9BACL|nr:ribonuclease HI family protein [Paenisporosarcina cavernae]AYC29434.1 reverse transcriptase-like protein [Paenisporosarcina cavernae]